MVRSRGLEPPRDFSHNDLNVARIPIPPRPHEKKMLPIEAIVRYIETSKESSIFAGSMADKLEWKIEKQPVAYPAALETMEKRVADIGSGAAPELIWLLEHPPLYTGGTSAKPSDLLDKKTFPVYETGRGGQYTYHGPGQRIAYTMLNLKERHKEPDLKRYVHDLEEWIIRTLAEFDIKGERRSGRVGIWVATGKSEAKIAALGIRVRKWVSYHGIAINVNPDLSHFGGIVPCGIKEHGVTSMVKFQPEITLAALDKALKSKFSSIF
jgi:lipoyl(octanoyl) transferase